VGLCAIGLLACSGSRGDDHESAKELRPSGDGRSTTVADATGAAITPTDASVTGNQPAKRTRSFPNPSRDGATFAPRQTTLYKAKLAALPEQNFAPALAKSVSKDATGKAESVRKRATGLATAKKYGEAITAYLEALKIDPGHLDVRFELAATYNLANQAPRGLALLRELLAARWCASCEALVDRARADVRWRSAWDTQVFHAVLRLESAHSYQEPKQGSAWYEKKRCPRGTRFRAKYTHRDSDEGTMWCEKPGGIKHGPYRMMILGCHMGEGSCSESGEYRNGKKHGPWSESPNYYGGYSGWYVRGARHGVWDLSEKEQDTVAVYVHGKLHGTIRTYYREGREDDPPMSREAAYEGGVQHGPYRAWTTYEEPYYLSETGTYRKGKKDGVWTLYDEKGLKWTEQSYRRGVRHGRFTYWDGGGKVLATTEMTGGSGDWVRYNSSRELLEKGKLVAGRKEGPWIQRRDFSSSRSKGNYVGGKPDGPWVVENIKNGVVLEKGRYAKGRRVGPWEYRNDEGKLVAKGRFVAGKPDGEWVVNDYDEPNYDDSGDPAPLSQKLTFRRGRLVSVDGERPSKQDRKAWRSSKGTWESSPGYLRPDPVGDEDYPYP
jgi:antitoxin component YwqK of YwqJK toxin-antitoxin module